MTKKIKRTFAIIMTVLMVSGLAMVEPLPVFADEFMSSGGNAAPSTVYADTNSLTLRFYADSLDPLFELYVDSNTSGSNLPELFLYMNDPANGVWGDASTKAWAESVGIFASFNEAIDEWTIRIDDPLLSQLRTEVLDDLGGVLTLTAIITDEADDSSQPVVLTVTFSADNEPQGDDDVVFDVLVSKFVYDEDDQLCDEDTTDFSFTIYVLVPEETPFYNLSFSELTSHEFPESVISASDLEDYKIFSRTFQLQHDTYEVFDEIPQGAIVFVEESSQTGYTADTPYQSIVVVSEVPEPLVFYNLLLSEGAGDVGDGTGGDGDEIPPTGEGFPYFAAIGFSLAGIILLVGYLARKKSIVSM